MKRPVFIFITLALVFSFSGLAAQSSAKPQGQVQDSGDPEDPFGRLFRKAAAVNGLPGGGAQSFPAASPPPREQLMKPRWLKVLNRPENTW